MELVHNETNKQTNKKHKALTFWKKRKKTSKRLGNKLSIDKLYENTVNLSAFWIAKNTKFLNTDNEDTYQTARMRRLIWVFVGRTCQKVRFLTLRFMFSRQSKVQERSLLIRFRFQELVYTNKGQLRT